MMQNEPPSIEPPGPGLGKGNAEGRQRYRKSNRSRPPFKGPERDPFPSIKELKGARRFTLRDLGFAVGGGILTNWTYDALKAQGYLPEFSDLMIGGWSVAVNVGQYFVKFVQFLITLAA